MRTLALALLASVAATPLLAQEVRELGAHVHGISELELAVEDGIVEMEMHSPGMDIVGFEYQASTAADKDAVAAAIRTLLLPENIVTLPEAAECKLTKSGVHLHAVKHDHDHEHGDHDHDHADGDHDHDHADGDHDHDHADADAAAPNHADAAPAPNHADAAAAPNHADGDDHDHDHEHADGDDHDHEHEAGEKHSEFHIAYGFSCEHPEKLTTIDFPFFKQFENAHEIDLTYTTATATGSTKVDHETAKANLD